MHFIIDNDSLTESKALKIIIIALSMMQVYFTSLFSLSPLKQ